MKVTQERIERFINITEEVLIDLQECGNGEWESMEDMMRATVNNIEHDFRLEFDD